MRKITTEDLRAAEGRVTAIVPQVLPPDSGFAERVREVQRAQPHLVDECMVDLFDNPELSTVQSAKLFFLVWIAIEALDAAWTPPKGFDGPTEYVYTPTEEELEGGEEADEEG